MTARKWTVLALLFVAAIVSVIALFYNHIQEEYWDEQKYVKASLREYFEPTQIDYAKKYVWDDTFWIVKGTTSDQVEKYVVWQDLNIIYSVDVRDVLTKEQFLQKLSVSNTTSISHIQPAFFRDELCFEVQMVTETKHKVYSFYTMREGRLIDQFTLPR